ncbi:MAG: hypothetical protein FWE12_08730 [Oscillospiraceae bacterium]|nr:hypothetical protein [Oscillospiraceae bacterium]
MQSILEEFFYGNISPEVQFIAKGSECDNVMRIICRIEEKLLERLNVTESIDRTQKSNLRLQTRCLDDRRSFRHRQ